MISPGAGGNEAGAGIGSGGGGFGGGGGGGGSDVGDALAGEEYFSGGGVGGIGTAGISAGGSGGSFLAPLRGVKTKSRQVIGGLNTPGSGKSSDQTKFTKSIF